MRFIKKYVPIVMVWVISIVPNVRKNLPVPNVVEVERKTYIKEMSIKSGGMFHTPNLGNQTQLVE